MCDFEANKGVFPKEACEEDYFRTVSWIGPLVLGWEVCGVGEVKFRAFIREFRSERSELRHFEEIRRGKRAFVERAKVNFWSSIQNTAVSKWQQGYQKPGQTIPRIRLPTEISFGRLQKQIQTNDRFL